MDETWDKLTDVAYACLGNSGYTGMLLVIQLSAPFANFYSLYPAQKKALAWSCSLWTMVYINGLGFSSHRSKGYQPLSRTALTGLLQSCE